jgi:hypothetical protein
MKDPKPGKTRAVVVRSKKECGIAWGSGAHLQLAGGFPGSNRQTCANQYGSLIRPQCEVDLDC